MSSIIKQMVKIVNAPDLYDLQTYKNAFLLIRLSRDFEEVIFDDNSETYDELILNNQLVDFMIEMLSNETFKKDLSNQALNEIRDILKESIRVRKEYEKTNNNPSFIRVEKRIKEFDVKRARMLLRMLFDLKMEREEERKKQKRWLNAAKTPKYEGDTEPVFLEENTIYDGECINAGVLRYWVLDNSFISIIDDLITYDGMSEIGISNAIEVIKMGLSIVENRASEFGQEIFEYINIDKISTFDEYRAKQVLERLIKRRDLMRTRGLVLLKFD